MPHILIVDDDAALRESIAEALTDLGHTTSAAPDGPSALALLATTRVDAVLLDLRMPGMDGLEVLTRIRALPHPPPVAVLTAVPTPGNTIAAMRAGAIDHLAKPIGRADLAALLTRMLPAASEPPAKPPATEKSEEPIGSSAAMRVVQKTIGLLADNDATVLITGESGSGKEVVARAIHRHGRRAARPFVPVNCAAIPAGLLESELFGHVRGAFTGAVADRLGSFREAQGGTLFLDEIGDMDPPLQAKLLRVLQERVVTPVGGKPVSVDVRILAATNRDLSALVRSGGFREDLYWRLGVVPLHLPPLRDRLADILPIAEFFLGPHRRLAADAAARLLSHPWPGNVRELHNAMDRAAALSRHPVITAADLHFLSGVAPTQTDWLEGDLPTALTRLETAMISRAMQQSGGNRSEAARRLGINRQLLHEKLRRQDPSANRTPPVRNPDSTDPAPQE